MTYAPVKIKEVRAFLKGEDPDLDDVELGIVGGPSHILTGTSYHLGADQLKMSKNPYSARTVRDRAGLSDAASALDIDDDLDELRELSVWCVQECRKGAPDTLDIREIIYSPDGRVVLRWDRERGVSSLPQPGEADLSHLKHDHYSWYRDSEHRDKVGLFKRFYGQRSPATGGDDMTPEQANQLRTLHELLVNGVRTQGSFTYTPEGGKSQPINPLYNAIWKVGEKVGAEIVMPDVDEDAIVRGLLATLTPQALVAALAPLLPTAEAVADAVLARKGEIATAVLDEDHARTRSAD